MGYNTDFTGKLHLPEGVKQEVIEEVRKHLYVESENGDVELMFEHYDEIVLIWDESEKTYNLDEQINGLIQGVRKKFPDFTLTGELHAQGEDPDDRWILRMVDGKAVVVGLSVEEYEDDNYKIREAAPEMLAALKDIVKASLRGQVEFKAGAVDVSDGITSAIRKAEGRA